MMRRIGLAAAIVAFGAVPGVAHATKFSGTCDPIKGTATFDPPLTSNTAHGSYDFSGSATCTGKVDGKDVNGSVQVAVKGAGDLSCSSGKSDMPGQGTLTFDATGQTVHFLMTFTATLSEVDITLTGEKGGKGTGHASFADKDHPENNLTTVQNCGGSGNKQLSFTANATVPDSAPLDDGVTASSNSSTTPSTAPNENGPSVTNEPSNTGSSQPSAQQQPKSKPKKKAKKKKKKCGKTKPKNRGKKHPKSSCGKAKGHS
jgi:hypothetical protein